MNHGLKRFILGGVFVLCVFHGMALFLFFGPVSVLVNFAKSGSSTFVSMNQIPSLVQQTFSFVQSPPQLDWEGPGNVWQDLNRGLLGFRYEKMKNEERRELVLNILPFGGGVYGLNDGALYYFQKPLNQLTDEEMVNLAGFYRVFGESI